ncbi:AbrB/MazE/SpoVT family DNA-binding domain-containing protein, partial [candidate division KSB1 bacterium]|nr:AbrB/MazE/SpoVT family DNA-binding domain-containing protein [candidate division KSB1 bacterium]
KALLTQARLGEEVKLEVYQEQIIIRPKRRAREGWTQAFRAMAEHGDDKLLDRENITGQSSWDEQEWEW